MEINNSLSDNSRVWIYQSNRPFSENEIESLNEKLKQFVKEWASHNRQLNADAFLLYNRFILLMVDEQMTGASGCSIDASVRFLKTLEEEFKVTLFDRFIFSYFDAEGQIQTVNSQEFSSLYKNKIITENTMVCDTLVDTKVKLKSAFKVPISHSWHKRFL